MWIAVHQYFGTQLRCVGPFDTASDTTDWITAQPHPDQWSAVPLEDGADN